MLSYQHILVATDLSEETLTVAQTALAIATRSQAQLSIVHVVEHTPAVYGGGEFSIPLDMSLEEHLAENAKRALADLSLQLKIPDKDQYVAHGSVKREIIELAKNLKIDLIIVGSHGHSGMEMLLGSTANAILHAAQCDVLSVKVTA